MSLPSVDDIQIPLLRLIIKQKIHDIVEAESLLGDYFELSPNQMRIKVPSGRRHFYSRVSFSLMILKRKNYILRGTKTYIATPKGKELMDKMVTYYLGIVNKLNDTEFEHYSGLLLSRMYKVSFNFDVDFTPQSDGGIDGILRLNGSNNNLLYFQSKLYLKNSIGSPLLRDFVGALEGVEGDNGVYITTSKYSGKAVKYVEKLKRHNITLIDGEKLVSLILRHNLLK